MLQRLLFKIRLLPVLLALVILLGNSLPAFASSNMLYWVPVSYGQQGIFVSIVQSMLVQRGYNIAIDRVFGQQTKDAVMSFQRTQGLDPDGIVGDQTWPRLIVSLRIGDRGPAVQQLQQMFLGINISVDSIYGKQTQGAVVNLEKGAGIDPDGIAGPQVWNLLMLSYTD